jgi:hypothetical protein
MGLEAKNLAALDSLDEILQSAQEPTLHLLERIVTGVCTRIPRRAKSETFDRLIHFAKIGAWTDAALALIAKELPLWRVRRLAYENGEWHCALSYQPNLPMAFDDCAEATHEFLCRLGRAAGRNGRRSCNVSWPKNGLRKLLWHGRPGNNFQLGPTIRF